MAGEIKTRELATVSETGILPSRQEAIQSSLLIGEDLANCETSRSLLPRDMFPEVSIQPSKTSYVTGLDKDNRLSISCYERDAKPFQIDLALLLAQEGEQDLDVYGFPGLKMKVEMRPDLDPLDPSKYPGDHCCGKSLLISIKEGSTANIFSQQNAWFQGRVFAVLDLREPGVGDQRTGGPGVYVYSDHQLVQMSLINPESKSGVSLSFFEILDLRR